MMSHAVKALLLCVVMPYDAFAQTSIDTDGINITASLQPGGNVLIRSLTPSGTYGTPDKVITSSALEDRLHQFQTTIMGMVQDILDNEETGYVKLQTFEDTLQNYMTASNIANLYFSKQEIRDSYAPLTVTSDLNDQIGNVSALVQNLTTYISSLDFSFPTCMAPTDIANGAPSDHFEHIPGTKVTYSCDPRYCISGSRIRECLSNGTWATPQPSCAVAPIGWYAVPHELRDFGRISGHAAFIFADRDFRSGNPGQTSTFSLPAVAILGGVTGLSFSYSYVVGYGRCGTSCTHTGPQFTVSVVNADDETQSQFACQSPVLIGYDYDTCGSRGGWGVEDVPADGCYSPLVAVNVTTLSGLQTATRVFVRFNFTNNQRNMHLDDDGLNVQIYGPKCP